MYYEFYIDVYFIENFIIDFVILILTAVFAESQIRWWRLLLAATFGAAGSCWLTITCVGKEQVLFIAGFLLLGIGMVTISTGIHKKEFYIRNVLYFFGISFLYGGIFQMIYGYVRLSVILVSLISAVLLTYLMSLYFQKKYSLQNLYGITLGIKSQTVKLIGLRDTGNQLMEPITGKPVSIVSYDAVKELLDQNDKIFVIPYHSVGKESGWLPGVTLDYISIEYKKSIRKIEKPMIAVSKIPVSREGRYQMILHPLLMDY